MRDVAVHEIRTRTIGDAPAEFNEDRFDFGAGADPAAVVSAARTLPVLSAARLVRVRGLDDRRAARFLEYFLPTYLQDPVSTTCLLLEARRIDRRTRWVKLVRECGEIRFCEAPSRPSELRPWVEARISASGGRAARGTAQALLDQLGSDPDRLASEIEKLVLYVGRSARVTPEDVAEAVGGVRPRAIFDLTDAIASGDRSRALRVLRDLLSGGEPPLALLAGLANHMRRMLRARECRPLDPSTVQRTLGVHPYAAQKLVEQVRGVAPESLRLGLVAVARADRALKGAVPLRPDRAMERLVLALVAR